MARVTGLGGVFFKSQDADKLRSWYESRLGLKANEHGVILFQWRDAIHPEQKGSTLLTPFPADTTYFDPSPAPYMFNFRVDNLDELLVQLRSQGVEVIGNIEEYDYGRFAWIMDPEGHRIELWEPPLDTGERGASAP